METESDTTELEQEKQRNFAILYKSTRFSKYLAIVLFISSPFAGGWIGYTYAPERVMEIGRAVEQAVETDLSSDERNKILIRENLANDLKINQGQEQFPRVLDEPNGFDPYANDPKARNLNINGLSFTNISRSRALTTIDFGLNRFTDEQVNVSGNFELWFDQMFGKLVLRFLPDDETQRILPWPSTNSDPYDKYLVVINDTDYSLADLCDSTCEIELSNSEDQRLITYSGSAMIESVTLEIQNIGVDSFGSSIKLYEMVLVKKEI